MNKSLSFSNFADDAHTLTNSFRLGGAALRRAAVMEATELAGHVSAGVIAGTVVEATLYPIDTIKTRLQAARGGASVNWRNLYKGIGGNLAGVVPACAVFFAVYEPAKRILLPVDGNKLTNFDRTVGAHLIAAASAGLAASIVRVPTEVVKSRMQTGQFASARGAVWHIASREGIASGLFAGFGSFLLRDLPFDAIEFASYEQMKLAWSSVDGGSGNEIKHHESAAIGAVAGMLTGAVTTPLDVVKTRLMTQGGKMGEKRYYKGVLDCVTRTVAEEGWIALLKGIGPRVTFIGLGGGVFFFVLEGAKKALGVDKRSATSSMSRADEGGEV